MFGAVTLIVVLVATATAAMAEDGVKRHPRLQLGSVDLLELAPPRSTPPVADPLSRLIDHFKHDAIGVRPLLTLLPPGADEGREARFPTFALFARANGRTLVSLTRVQARADAGQNVVLQRTLVSDLFAGRRFSLTVYEDHVLGETATRLMGVGTRMTFRPTVDVFGWRLRLELLGSYDLQAGASAYFAVSGMLQPPPLAPVTLLRSVRPGPAIPVDDR